jgi:cytidylate kinase
MVTPVKRVVTVSSSYGAGGSVVGPALAQLLDMPFLDRAVPARLASGQPLSSEEAAVEERTPGLIERIVATFARLPDAFGPGAPPAVEGYAPEDDLRRETEQRVRAFVELHGRGVVLGWGATVLVPEAFHVRLDGPVEARVRRAMEIQGVEEDEARRRREETDRVRSQYMRRLHGKDWKDPALYHMVLDTTSMALDDAAKVVCQAACAFWSKREAAP